MFENPRRGRQARNFTTNAPKILDLKSSSEQIFSRKLPLGAPDTFDRPETIRDRAKMNLAGHRDRRLSENYFDPLFKLYRFICKLCEELFWY